MHRLSQELELKQHSLSLLEERARGSEAHQLAEAAAATEKELGEAQQAVQVARERKQELVAAAKVGNMGRLHTQLGGACHAMQQPLPSPGQTERRGRDKLCWGPAMTVAQALCVSHQ